MRSFSDLEAATEYLESFLKWQDVVILDDKINDFENEYTRKIYYQRGKGYGKTVGTLFLYQVCYCDKEEFTVINNELVHGDIAKFKELGCLTDLIN